MSSIENLTKDNINSINEKRQQETAFGNLSILEKIIYIKNCITVEPILCLYIFPVIVGSMAIQNLQLQMACRTNLNLNDTICANLLSVNNSDYEKEVEKKVTEILPWKTALSTTIPAVLVLFYGSYSDRYKKRKPFFIMPIIGQFLSAICFTLCAINIANWPVEAEAFTGNIFSSFFGGAMLLQMAVYSYIADISTPEMRTVRIGFVHIIVASIVPIGISLSGILFAKIGYIGIFSIFIICYAIAFFYGIFYIKEPQIENPIKSTKCICIDLYDPRHIVDTVVTIFKKRSGTKRLRIILLLFTFFIVLGPATGDNAIIFYYTRTKFHWNSIQYSFYSTYDVIIHIIGLILAICIFSQWLKLDDLLLAVIACSSKIIACIINAFSTPALFYFAPFVSMFSGAGMIAMRSIATKLVTNNELGKMQSLTGICESFSPLIYSFLHSNVYAATIDIFPGAFYLTDAALMIPAICIFLTMYKLKKTEEMLEKSNSIIIPEKFKYTTSKTET